MKLYPAIDILGGTAAPAAYDSKNAGAGKTVTANGAYRTFTKRSSNGKAIRR